MDCTTSDNFFKLNANIGKAPENAATNINTATVVSSPEPGQKVSVPKAPAPLAPAPVFPTPVSPVVLSPATPGTLTPARAPLLPQVPSRAPSAPGTVNPVSPVRVAPAPTPVVDQAPPAVSKKPSVTASVVNVVSSGPGPAIVIPSVTSPVAFPIPVNVADKLIPQIIKEVSTPRAPVIPQEVSFVVHLKEE